MNGQYESENDSDTQKAPVFPKPRLQSKSHAPETQVAKLFAGWGQGSHLDPQEFASVSEEQVVPHRWNPAAQGNSHLPATHAGSVPGGALAVQSTQTLTPQSLGAFVHEPVTAFAERVVPPSGATSFDPLPQAIDDSTATTTISLAMKVSPRG